VCSSDLNLDLGAHGDVGLDGYLAYDDGSAKKRPGVLVVHEWWGLDAFAKDRARQLASMGYVAFAVDMYGQGVVTDNATLASRLSAQFQCQPLGRDRMNEGLKVLAGNPRVDPKRIAAIGFSFGGTMVLELAYSGAAVAGVVSFHGNLPSPRPEDDKNIKAKILVLHGAEDPLVSREEIELFLDSMKKTGVDWQMVTYGGAAHGFLNPSAGKARITGVAYDRKAEKRAWKQMKDFLQEVILR